MILAPADRDARAENEPVSGDRQNGLWSGYLLSDAPPTLGVAVVQYGVRRIAVSEKDRRRDLSHTGAPFLL